MCASMSGAHTKRSYHSIDRIRFEEMGALLKLGKWTECDNYMRDGGMFFILESV